jgi:hypothetical protein
MGKYRQILTRKIQFQLSTNTKDWLFIEKNGPNSKKKSPKSPDFNDNKAPVGSQEYRRDSGFFLFWGATLIPSI